MAGLVKLLSDDSGAKDQTLNQRFLLMRSLILAGYAQQLYCLR